MSAMLYRPREIHQAIVEMQTGPDVAKHNSHDEKSCSFQVTDRFLSTIPEDNISVSETSNNRRRSSALQIPKTCHMAHSMEDISTDSTIYLKERKQSVIDTNKKQKQKSKSWKKSVARYIDFALLRNPLFLLMASTVMMMVGY